MMRKNVFEVIGIFLFSVSLALITNQFRSDGIPLIRPSTSPIPISSEDSQAEDIVPLQVLMEKLNHPGVIILDARSPEEFWEGHIPGARNLPYYELSEESTFIVQEVPFDMEIITYCEGIECSSAEDLAILLKEIGYEDVKVFTGGWEEWIENGMPVDEEGGWDNEEV